MGDQSKSVAIIGAGPVGLAAAAHAVERGLRPLVLEAGSYVGHAARRWGHVRMFSPWQYNIDRAAERLLARAGWNSPDPHHYPTGAELVERYLEPLASRTELQSYIQTSSRVTAISRVGFDRLKTKGRDQAPFELRYQNGVGPKTVLADAVIDASGSWSLPNPAGANGLDAIGEGEARDRIAYAMPDVLGEQRQRYANNAVAVLGSGHSAVGTLIDLVRLKESAPQTHIIWLLRGDRPEKAFGGGVNDKLAARGELGTAFARLVAEGHVAIEASFKVKSLAVRNDRLVIESSTFGRDIIADELIVATGFRPDLSFLRELRISLDPALECPPMLAPLIDPNEHSCGTVRAHGAQELAQPEPGFYFAGMKAYGRAPTFLMLTGYEQVRSIVAEIAGDHEAARRVEPVLPETGVCAASQVSRADASVGCCGGPAPAHVDACCVQDAVAKAIGAQGCGCGSKAAEPAIEWL